MKNCHSKLYKLEKNDHNLRSPFKLCENCLLSSLSLLVKSFEEEIQLSNNHVDITRG